MFAKALLLLAAFQGIVIPFGRPRVIEQPRAPIQSEGPRWAVQCEGAKDPESWTKPAPPVRIHANTYLVGTCGISSILIVGSAGNVLIDGGTEEDAGLIADNIRALGYNVRDIRFILTSHEHFDHAGGIAKLQQLSGATVVTSPAAAKVLSTGTPSPDDPQFGAVKGFPPVQVGRTVRDGEEVLLGNIVLTALATPGHTPGALTWHWGSCDGGVCRSIVYADSLTPVSAPAYRYSDHPDVVAAFRASIAKIADSPCEILLTPHPGASQMPERLALGRPLLDGDACKTYAAAKARDLDDRLAREAAAPAPAKP